MWLVIQGRSQKRLDTRRCITLQFVCVVFDGAGRTPARSSRKPKRLRWSSHPPSPCTRMVQGGGRHPTADRSEEQVLSEVVGLQMANRQLAVHAVEGHQVHADNLY